MFVTKKSSSQSAGAKSGGTSIPAGQSSGRLGAKPGQSRPARFEDWWAAARPGTLFLAPVPVLAGSASALQEGLNFHNLFYTVSLIVVLLLLQVGVNFANDWGDWASGVDAGRAGAEGLPFRLASSGLVRPGVVRRVAIVFFALSGVAAIVFSYVSDSWWVMFLGIIALWAGWKYSCGSGAYGRYGLGEVVVFVFYGIVGVFAVDLVQSGTLDVDVLFPAIASGLLCAAPMLINNIRDRDVDAAARKWTIVRLLGRRLSCVLLVLFIVPAIAYVWYMVPLFPSMKFAYFSLFLFVPGLVIAFLASSAREYVVSLKVMSFGAFVWSLMIYLASFT